MPTILSHPAVPLALGLALGGKVVSRRLLLAGVVASVVPDLDVIAFRVGISYAHELGHRGISHSILFAVGLAVVAALSSRWLGTSRRLAFAFVLVSGASHGLLDMLTNGGLGVAYFWPFSNERLFFPVQVIEVSPLSLRRFFGPAGAVVLQSEALWIWAPCLFSGLLLRAVRNSRAL